MFARTLAAAALATVAITAASAQAEVLYSQLGILDLTANNGDNPATNEAWKLGDEYRLAFVVHPANALHPRDKTIADFNNHVQSVANASTVSRLGEATWRVIGSTTAVDARQNTGTDPTADGPGHAIFRLDSVVVAKDYAQLWSGAIENPLNRTQHNQHRPSSPNYAMYPYTGTDQNGTRVVGQELGVSGHVRAGASDNTTIWMNGGSNYTNTTQGSYYAMSLPLMVLRDAVDRLWDGGSGTWNTTSVSWKNRADAAYAWSNIPKDKAFFGDLGSTAGTVTLGESVSVGGLTFNNHAGYVIDGDGHTLTFAVPGSITTNVDATISADLTGGAAIEKDGAAKLTLTQDAASGYTGTMSITDGTLGVSGSFGGSLTVQDGAALSIGPGIAATLDMDDNPLTWGSGSTIHWQFLNTDSYDQVTGSLLDLPTSGDITIAIEGLEGYSVNVDDTFTLFDGAVANFSADRFAFTWPGAGSWTISEGNSLMLTYVPEPSSALLALLGLVGLLMVRRRR